MYRKCNGRRKRRGGNGSSYSLVSFLPHPVWAEGGGVNGWKSHYAIDQW